MRTQSSLLIIIVALLSNISEINADEINKIKREGNEYNDSLSSTISPEAKRQFWGKAIDNFHGTISQPFLGDVLPEDFGKSQYDKTINPIEYLQSGKSLEELRKERKNKEISSIIENYNLVAIILLVIFLLLITLKKRSDMQKKKNTESNNTKFDASKLITTDKEKNRHGNYEDNSFFNDKAILRTLIDEQILIEIIQEEMKDVIRFIKKNKITGLQANLLLFQTIDMIKLRISYRDLKLSKEQIDEIIEKEFDKL